MKIISTIIKSFYKVTQQPVMSKTHSQAVQSLKHRLFHPVILKSALIALFFIKNVDMGLTVVIHAFNSRVGRQKQEDLY